MFGFVQEFIQNPDSKTGYQVKVLLFGQEGEYRTFDATEEVFQIQYDPHFSFPLIGEYCFFLEVDPDGVLTKLTSAVKSGIAKAAYSFGSPKTVASVLDIYDDRIEFTALEEQLEEGRLAYYDDYRFLDAPPATKGSSIPLSKDLCIYCLDWTKNDTCVSLVTMDFLRQVLNDNVYWMDIQSLHGGDPVEYDNIMIFRNYEKDPNTFDGDLAQKSYSKEDLTKPHDQDNA